MHITRYSVYLVFIFVIDILMQIRAEPQQPATFIDSDQPQWALSRREYVPEMKGESAASDYYKCSEKVIIRNKFGNVRLPKESEAVPIVWSDILSVAARIFSNPQGTYFLDEDLWPALIMPFLFCLMGIAAAIILIFPILLVGGIVWAILYNLRYLGHRKIRRFIRSLLIKKEKLRRWFYEHIYPPQHLRKFRERDRYAMPTFFQRSDVSSDDEPVELQRHPIPRQKTTMWSRKEIHMLGFDPDNIPMGKIYGDLIDQPDELAPEVKAYIRKKSDLESNPDFGKSSINSDDWVEALRSKVQEIQSQGGAGTFSKFWSKVAQGASQMLTGTIFGKKEEPVPEPVEEEKPPPQEKPSRIRKRKEPKKPVKKVEKVPSQSVQVTKPVSRLNALADPKRRRSLLPPKIPNSKFTPTEQKPNPSVTKLWVPQKNKPESKQGQAGLGRLNPNYQSNTPSKVAIALGKPPAAAPQVEKVPDPKPVPAPAKPVPLKQKPAKAVVEKPTSPSQPPLSPANTKSQPPLSPEKPQPSVSSEKPKPQPPVSPEKPKPQPPVSPEKPQPLVSPEKPNSPSQPKPSPSIQTEESPPPEEGKPPAVHPASAKSSEASQLETSEAKQGPTKESSAQTERRTAPKRDPNDILKPGAAIVYTTVKKPKAPINYNAKKGR